MTTILQKIVGAINALQLTLHGDDWAIPLGFAYSIRLRQIHSERCHSPCFSAKTSQIKNAFRVCMTYSSLCANALIAQECSMSIKKLIK
jgi:hypothetical protein